MLNHITMFQPSAIDNALSTMQILHKLITQINTIIDEINSIDSKANEYTDEQIKILNDKIENELIELEKTLKEYSDTLNNNLKTYVDKQDKFILDLLSSSIVTIREEMNKLENKLKLYIDTNDSKIYVYINKIYKELYDLIMNGNDIIYSPIDGFLKSTKDVIQDLTNVLQIKNGISWNIFELLCNGGLDDMIGFTQPNIDFNIYIKFIQPSYAHIDYVNENGILIVTNNAINTVKIDNELYTNWTGAGVLIPLSYFVMYERTIVITDVNNLVTTIKIKNTDYSLKPVTWNSMEQRLNEQPNARYSNWNSLSFYTVAFANLNLMRTDGTLVGVLPEIMYTTEYNKEFFGGI